MQEAQAGGARQIPRSFGGFENCFQGEGRVSHLNFEILGTAFTTDGYRFNSSSSALASFKSIVPKSSVNQP